MAQQALGAGTVLPRKRALFGLLDADGWAWASVKAFAWLVFIILILFMIFRPQGLLGKADIKKV